MELQINGEEPFEVDDEVYEAAQKKAKEEGISIEELLVKNITEFLDKYKVTQTEYAEWISAYTKGDADSPFVQSLIITDHEGTPVAVQFPVEDDGQQTDDSPTDEVTTE
jgi:hypothetical protein